MSFPFRHTHPGKVETKSPPGSLLLVHRWITGGYCGAGIPLIICPEAFTRGLYNLEGSGDLLFILFVVNVPGPTHNIAQY